LAGLLETRVKLGDYCCSDEHKYEDKQANLCTGQDLVPISHMGTS